MWLLRLRAICTGYDHKTVGKYLRMDGFSPEAPEPRPKGSSKLDTFKAVTLDHKTVLVTGSPGFIGANLVIRLLREMRGGAVVSLDNMNDYYDPPSRSTASRA